MRIHRTSGCLLLNQHLCFLIVPSQLCRLKNKHLCGGFRSTSIVFYLQVCLGSLVPILNRNIRSICFFFSDQWSIRPSLTDDTSTPLLSTTKSSFLHTLRAIKFSLGQRTTAGWCGVGDYAGAMVGGRDGATTMVQVYRFEDYIRVLIRS